MLELTLSFALEKIDGVIDDKTTVNGVERGQFRLHSGKISFGCVTCKAGLQYNNIVKELRNSPIDYIPNTNIRFYGILHVQSSKNN